MYKFDYITIFLFAAGKKTNRMCKRLCGRVRVLQGSLYCVRFQKRRTKTSHFWENL